jgi:hypothetical protein
MPVKRRLDKRRPDVSDAIWGMLNDDPPNRKDFALDDALRSDSKSWDVFWFRHSLNSGHRHAKHGYSVEDLWRQYGDEIVTEWIGQHPGTRPSCWWRFDAPEPLPDGESQLSYLMRRRLLLPCERRQLRL